MTNNIVDKKEIILPFSVNLLDLSKEHICFLRSLHRQGVSWNRPSLESLRRYEDLWLPLVHHNSLEKDPILLIPPADISWLWHCHRLAPVRYTLYCKKQFEYCTAPLEAHPPFQCVFCEDDTFDSEEGKVNKENTKTLWNQLYPNEPFFLQSLKQKQQQQQQHEEEEEEQAQSPTNETKSSNKEEDGYVMEARPLLQDGFDLLGAAERQSTFLWQVSTPLFFDNCFLQEGIDRYYKFLKLRTFDTGSDQVIVPTYPIDLMWHTHILSSLWKYNQDCRSILGSTLNHDDNFGDGDRTPGAELDTAFRATKNLWKRHYQEEYIFPGGMYRGEPPKEYYSPTWGTSLEDWQIPPMSGPYLNLVGIHGASSTNPYASLGQEEPAILWCWKETASQMSRHSTADIVGNPTDCWIKYDDKACKDLEKAFQEQGGIGNCSLSSGYNVNFTTMKQAKVSTGYQRDVQRISSTAKVWCWRETASRMSEHTPSQVFGDPTECWIRYDSAASQMLESAFLAHKNNGQIVCSPNQGYVVNFATMKQRNLKSGYERQVQRVDDVSLSNDITATTPRTNDPNVVMTEWTDVNGKAPDGCDAFVPASIPSKNTRVNPNPFKDKYIFGKHGKRGLGYYHITTKEAYEILEKRIQKNEQSVAQELAWASCMSCYGKSRRCTRLEEKLNSYHKIREIVSARAKAPTPVGMAGITTQKDKEKYGEHYSDEGYWYFPYIYYAAGGTCGATVRGSSVTTKASVHVGTYCGAACGDAGCGGGCGGGGGGCGGGGGGGCGGGGCGGGGGD